MARERKTGEEGAAETIVIEIKEDRNVAKKSRSKHLGSVRRSQRLPKPAAVPNRTPGRLDAEILIQDIIDVESKDEDEEEPMLQEHEKILQGLTTPKGTKRAFSDAATSEGEMSYKNLYIESQKKVEALTEEKQQLFVQLMIAHGQIEIYEKLTRTNELVLNVSNEATRNPYVSQDTGNGKNSRRKKEANGVTDGHGLACKACD